MLNTSIRLRAKNLKELVRGLKTGSTMLLVSQTLSKPDPREIDLSRVKFSTYRCDIHKAIIIIGRRIRIGG